MRRRSRSWLAWPRTRWLRRSSLLNGPRKHIGVREAKREEKRRRIAALRQPEFLSSGPYAWPQPSTYMPFMPDMIRDEVRDEASFFKEY